MYFSPFLQNFSGMNPMASPGYGGSLAAATQNGGPSYGAPQIGSAPSIGYNSAAGIPKMNLSSAPQPQQGPDTMGQLGGLFKMFGGGQPGQAPASSNPTAQPPATLNGTQVPLLAHLFPSLAPNAVPNTPTNNYFYGLTGGQGMPIPGGGGGFLSGLFGGGISNLAAGPT